MLSKMILIAVVLSVLQIVQGLELVALISQRGVSGQVKFRSLGSVDAPVTIVTELEETLQYPEQTFSWAIRSYPVDYSKVDPEQRCQLNDQVLGPEQFNFDEELGYLAIPENKTTRYTTSSITLTGPKGIWGKSLVLYNDDVIICATITAKDSSLEHSAESRFLGPIVGSIHFRWLASKSSEHSETLVYAKLQHTRKTAQGRAAADLVQHRWKIYATDIVENIRRTEGDCNSLQLVFDPQNSEPGKTIGDLDNRLGPLPVNVYESGSKQSLLKRDGQLVLLPSDLTGLKRRLYVVIFDSDKTDDIVACAEIRHIRSRVLKSVFNSNNMRGEIQFTQNGRFEPTWVNVSVAPTDNDHLTGEKYAARLKRFQITTLPPQPGLKSNFTHYCNSSGPIFNPTNINMENLPPPGLGTQDQYSIGDLTGKLLGRNKDMPHIFFSRQSGELSGLYWDIFLPLYGKNSVIHRNLVLTENIGCGPLLPYTSDQKYLMPMKTVEILYRYPIVGRILMRQPKEQPWEETIIIFEYMTLADGNTPVDSYDHRWGIHENPPGKDFYNWTGRCLSAGATYNPHRLDTKPTDCKDTESEMCRMGDLGSRLGLLTIAGSKYNTSRLSRKMFIDDNTPLSGRGSVIGKSLVIFADHGPVARGERLACSIIGGYARRKAVAKDWYSNGELFDTFKLSGAVEIIQQTEYDVADVEVSLKGLLENSGYHVHLTPVEGHLEFPCEESTLYGHWNPNHVNNKDSPQPATGSFEKYEMGDLSGKFGTLDGLTSYDTTYNDTNLPLFGYESILGRSVVIHKKEKNARWACSTLERGYSPSEAREIRGIASFHHPAGYAYGYIKFTQLIGSDGSQSETVINAKLRHPGKNDRNATLNHNWNIFVNPIGVDATVKQTATRCVAGGYVWNPFYTQLADPLNRELYESECGPDNPLRCYVGDVGARLGTININGERASFTDSNFPLEGLVTAIGRSIVIFGPDNSRERFACANIEPDHNIIKYINVERPPRFVLAQFLEDVRHVMGLPEWMLAVDSRKTKVIHNGACMQMIMHFMGPKAHQIEIDLSKLLGSGRLDQPSVSTPGFDDPLRKKTLSYKLCSVNDPNDKKKKKNNNFNFSFSKSGGATAASISAMTSWVLPLFLTIIKLGSLSARSHV